jgi:hypothetical protein
MFKKSLMVSAAALVCAAPASASATSCEWTCEHDLVAGERVPEGALGVLMYSWDGEAEEDTSADWSVQVERAQPDGSYAVVPHALVTVPFLGAMVRPDQMAVGDVFRVQTELDTSSGACFGPGDGPVVHEFEVVGTPAPGDFDGLTVAPAVLSEETGEYVDYIERTGTGRTYVAKVSTVGVEVALPPEFEALVGSIRVEFYLDGALVFRDRNLCHPALHWRDQQVVDGVAAADVSTVCEILDESQREGTDALDRDVQRPDGVVRARIFVPGTTLEWWSEEEQLAFSCDPPSGSGDAGGAPSADAGADAGGVSADTGDGSEQGGGCAQGGGRVPAPLGWLGLGVALGWFVRRRR